VVLRKVKKNLFGTDFREKKSVMFVPAKPIQKTVTTKNGKLKGDTLIFLLLPKPTTGSIVQ